MKKNNKIINIDALLQDLKNIENRALYIYQYVKSLKEYFEKNYVGESKGMK